MKLKEHFKKIFALTLASATMLCAVAANTYAGTNIQGDTRVEQGHNQFTFDFSILNDTVTINLENTINYVDVVGEKTWVSDTEGGIKDHFRPENITVHLYANGSDTGQSVTTDESQNWRYSFTDLDKYSEGEPITYSVKEDVPDHYRVSYASEADHEWYTSASDNEVYAINITNTFEKSYGNINGEKIWHDDNDRQGMRPDSITIHLYADGKDTGISTTTDASKSWKYEFKNLEILDYKNDCHKIEYSVKEDVPTGYTVEYVTVKNE